MKIILNDTLKQKGKSQYWLANQTGIAASTLNNLCNNKTSGVQFSVLDKICIALDCDVSDILCHEQHTVHSDNTFNYNTTLEDLNSNAEFKIYEHHTQGQQ